MNTEHGLGPCPSELGLERLRVGELGAPEVATVTAHVERCAACTKRLAVLVEAPPPFALDAVWQEARAAATRAQARRPSFLQGFGRLLLLGLTAAAVIAAVAVELRPTPPGDLTKGGDPWRLTVIAKQGEDGAAIVVSGAKLVPGDRLRFQVTTSWDRGYVAIFSLDGAGAVSALVPFTGETVEVRGGERSLLAGAVELDETLGPERIELLGCRRPLPVTELTAALREALTRAGGDLRKVGALGPPASACHRETFWIETVRKP
jgi:hypothetical protein